MPSPPRTNIGLGYIDPSVDGGRGHEGRVPRRPDDDPDHQRSVGARPPAVRPDPAQAHLGRDDVQGDRRGPSSRRHRSGSGPYQLQEWKTGEFAKFARNPNYWGKQGAADEIVIQQFGSADTLVQALKAGEIDYARGANAEQFDALKTEPNIATVAGQANGWTELGFNTYGTGTGNTIPDGGPSTPALQDPAFRDALGYAHRQGGARRSDPPGLRRRRHHADPAGPPGMARRTDEPEDLRPRRRGPEADGGRLRQGRVRGQARQGRQRRSASRWSSRATTRTTPRQPSSSRAGSSRSA